MPDARQAQATTNLTAVVVLGLMITAVVEAIQFNGLVRWIAEAEMRALGTYWEPSIYGVLVIVMAGLLWLFAMLAKRFPARVSNALTTTLILAGCALAIFKAWALFEYAAHLPTLKDPIQVVDLDQVGDGPLPAAHVRLVGTIEDTRRAVEVEGGGSLLGTRQHVDRATDNADLVVEFVPVVGVRTGQASTKPFRVVTRRGEFPARAGEFEGLLDDGELWNRNLYQLRRGGLDVDARVLVLKRSPQEPDQWYFMSAVVLFPVVLMFVMWLYTVITGRTFGVQAGKT